MTTVQSRSRRKGRGSGFPCDQLQCIPGAGSCRPKEPGGKTAESFPTSPSPTSPSGGGGGCCPGEPWWRRARVRNAMEGPLGLWSGSTPGREAAHVPQGSFPRTAPRPSPRASPRPRRRALTPNPGRARGPLAARPRPHPWPSAAATHWHHARHWIPRVLSHFIVETTPARGQEAGQANGEDRRERRKELC